MKQLIASWWLAPLLILAACGREEPAAPAAPVPATQAPAATAPEQPAPTATAEPENAAEAPAQQPTEAISETDEPADEGEQTAGVQPALRLGQAGGGAPTSARFREGANYQKVVPAQPTSVGPDKVEALEVFWYGCGHCYSLEPAIESWRSKNKPAYVEFVRVPAMWNEVTRLHARLFYTAEALGKLDAVHTPIFRELHVNGNQLNTVEKMTEFFQQHGVSPDEFKKAFSSFAVESKLKRADFLNRRYRIDSVPAFIVAGKYKTDIGAAGGEQPLFALIEELAAHEHGG